MNALGRDRWRIWTSISWDASPTAADGVSTAEPTPPGGNKWAGPTFTRLAYSEALPDEKAETVVGFFTRAAESFQQYGITIEEVMTDNHLSYTRSRAFAALLRQHGIKHITIKPHCPWQNGKAERHNRTLKQEWAYQKAYYDNQTRDQALPDWIHYYHNHQTVTNLPAGYT